jgi:hypothetical protein
VCEASAFRRCCADVIRSPILSLSWLPLFDKYSEYSPAGNVIGNFAYVLFLFSTRVLLTSELATTFRSKDCADHLAQRSRLVCIRDIIRSYSRESKSPQEQCSLSYPSPLSVLTRTAHCVSFVLVFLLTVRHMCLFQFILLFCGLHFVAK